jgi:ABC-type transporter Mla subunit MlaD
MRTPLSRFEKRAIVFLSVVGLIVVGALYEIAKHNDLRDFFRREATIALFASDGKGLGPGSSVVFRGIVVGSVQRIDLERSRFYPGRDVKLILGIQPKYVTFLGADTRATINVPPFGASSIVLSSEGMGKLPDPANLMADDNESLAESLTALAKDLGGMAKKFGSALDELSEILADVHTVSSGLASGKGAVGRVLSDKQAEEDIGATLSNVRATTENAKRAAVHVAEGAGSAVALVGDLRDSVADVRKLVQSAGPVGEKVPELVASVERTLAKLEALVTDLRTATAYVPGLARKADVALEETNRLVDAIQHNFIVRSTLSDYPEPRTETLLRATSGRPATKGAPAQGGAGVRTGMGDGGAP